MQLLNYVCCAGSLHLAGCRGPRLPLTATCNQVVLSGLPAGAFQALPGAVWLHLCIP